MAANKRPKQQYDPWLRLYSTQDLFLSAFVLKIVFFGTRPKLDDDTGWAGAA